MSAWLGGYPAAALSTVLGFLASNTLFMEPQGQLAIQGPRAIVSSVAYFISCAVIIGIAGAARKAQLLLRHRRDLLGVTLASIGDAVITTDLEGRVTFLNRVAESLTGWSLADAVGQPLNVVFRILNEKTREPAENPAARALREGTIVGLANSTLLIGKDGVERLIDDSASPIRDDHGWVSGSVLIFRDISERRRAREAQALLASIVRTSDDAIVSKTLEGKILSWNNSAERLFGYTAAEAVGKPITIIIPPERLHEEATILEKLRLGERLDHFETVRVAKDGRRLEISLTISPIHDGDGRIIGASKIARDIAERKRTEEALHAVERQLQIVTDSMSAPVTRCSRDLRYLWVGKHYAEWLGLSPEEIIGHPIEDVIGSEALATIRPYIDQVLSGREVRYEERVHFKGLGLRWIHAIYTPTFDANGETDGWVAVVLDIDQRKRTEEALKEADRRKDEFLATLAHELRNPLAPVRNSIEVMKRAGLNPELVVQARDTIDRQMTQMERLIEDLLDVSRITHNRLELRKQRTSLESVIHQAVEACRPMAECAEHEVRVVLPPEPIHLHADPARLAQVFGNLLNNSCRYTNAKGQIVISAERQGSEVRVSVKDNGIGIQADMLGRIFETFTQADQSLERMHGGLGLGLTLVKQIVKMHGGDVEAKSEGLGKGSEFVVRLPVLVEGTRDAEAPPVPTAAATSGVPPRRILIVDDNEDSAESLAMLLEISDHDTRSAYDGEQALRIAEEFRPHVVLLDIGLPKLNGYEVCRRIRQEPWGKDILMVALTGWGQNDDRRKSREAGFDAHLVKPVGHESLMEVLSLRKLEEGPPA
jgi:PAS domain S-box-containing protein